MSFKRYYLKDKIQNKSEDSSSYLFDISKPHNILQDLSLENVLLYLTVSRFGKYWNSLSHSHSFSEFFCITKGKGSFTVDGHTFDAGKNDIVIVNPNIEHSEASSSADPMEYIVLGMENIIYESKDQNYYFVHSSEHSEDISFYFHALVREMEKKQEYQAEFCQNLLNILFILISRVTKADFSVVSGENISKECLLAKNYIERYFHENLTLDNIAELVHLNKYYLIRSFTRAFGLPPIDYLIGKRIEECKNLLVNTDMSLSMISEAVGFSSQSYFSQRFKKETGFSPQEFRKQYVSGQSGDTEHIKS